MWIVGGWLEVGECAGGGGGWVGVGWGGGHVCAGLAMAQRAGACKTDTERVAHGCRPPTCGSCSSPSGTALATCSSYSCTQAGSARPLMCGTDRLPQGAHIRPCRHTCLENGADTWPAVRVPRERQQPAVDVDLQRVHASGRHANLALTGAQDGGPREPAPACCHPGPLSLAGAGCGGAAAAGSPPPEPARQARCRRAACALSSPQARSPPLLPTAPTAHGQTAPPQIPPPTHCTCYSSLHTERPTVQGQTESTVAPALHGGEAAQHAGASPRTLIVQQVALPLGALLALQHHGRIVLVRVRDQDLGACAVGASGPRVDAGGETRPGRRWRRQAGHGQAELMEAPHPF